MKFRKFGSTCSNIEYLSLENELASDKRRGCVNRPFVAKISAGISVVKTHQKSRSANPDALMAPLWQRLIFKNIFVIGSVETKTLRIAFQRKQVSEVLS